MAAYERRRLGGEDGVAIVEAAMISPILFLLLFGILEFSNLYFARETLANGSTAIARIAAIKGADFDADYAIVQAAKNSMGAIPSSKINRLVVWNASPRSGCSGSYCQGAASVAPCKTGTSSSSLQCNVYTPGTHWSSSLTAADFDCAPNPAPNYANAWCPTSRKTALTGSNGPPDYLGIYIEYQHDWVTGLFGNSITMGETKITKLEPTRVT